MVMLEGDGWLSGHSIRKININMWDGGTSFSSVDVPQAFVSVQSTGPARAQKGLCSALLATSPTTF
jgi:hypothetical protein